MRPIPNSTTRFPRPPQELSLEFGGKPYNAPVLRTIPEEEVRRRRIDQLFEIERRRRERRVKPPAGVRRRGRSGRPTALPSRRPRG